MSAAATTEAIMPTSDDNVLTPQLINQLKVSPEIITELRGLLKVFHEYCITYQLQYWAIGGTLLGLVRHNDVIPWDDDIDVGILDIDKPKLLMVLQAICKDHKNTYNFEMTGLVRTSGWKLRRVCNTDPKFHVDIDVFIFERVSIPKSVTNNKLIRTKVFESDENVLPWPYDVFNEEDMYVTDDWGGVQNELKLYDFGPDGGEIFAPCNPYPYLNTKYKNWRDYAVVFNHHKHSVLYQKKLKIPSGLF